MEPFVLKPATWCRHEYKSCPDGCPIEVAEGRLREAHRHWHDCLEAYQSPEDFRGSLNSVIQALRNVTFMLQAAKSEVPGFDAWYEGEQNTMRTDLVLRWAVDARNTVVKQGDLETHSWLRVSLVTGYHDEAEAVRLDQLAWDRLLGGQVQRVSPTAISAPVASSPISVFRSFDRLELPLRVRQDSAILLERRWVAETRPDEELLTLLAHAYGQLRGVVQRCHRLLGMEAARVSIPIWPTTDSTPSEVEYLEELPNGGRLPCMLSSRDHRTARYHLVDGTEVTEFLSRQIPPDPAITLETLKAAYGDMPVFEDGGLGRLQSKNDLSKLVSRYSIMATQVLGSGQDHGWFTFYFRHGRALGNRIHMTEDAQGKQAIASNIARAALEYEADMVVLIGEVWLSPRELTVDGAYQPPSLHPERREAVLVYAAARSGDEASLLIPFRHISGEPPSRVVEMDAPVPDTVHDVGALRPTRRAWGLTAQSRGVAFFKRER